AARRYARILWVWANSLSNQNAISPKASTGSNLTPHFLAVESCKPNTKISDYSHRVPRPRTRAATRLEQAAGTLSHAAIAKMDREFRWFHRLSAEHRSSIGLIAQSGIAAFVKWYREPERGPAVPIDVFSEAPPELMRVVSLQQTVEME